ncbi:hypothetical protein [Priestia aryabhattai]
MENNFFQINSWITLNKLQNATREEFERYAQFILLLTHKNYRKTRLNKDGGIDGYSLLVDKLLVKRDFKYDFYSIYGPDAVTPWEQKKAKLKKDYESILNHIDQTQTQINKWYIVTNFDFTHQYELEIASICEENEIEFELLYPQKIVSLLDTPEHIYKALAFVDHAPAPEEELTNYGIHIFAEKALKLLCEYENRTTTEQFELLNYLRSSLLFFIPEEQYFKAHLKSFNSIIKLRTLIIKNTTLNNEKGFLVHQYPPELKRFFTYNLEQAEAQDILFDRNVALSKNENGTYSLFIKNLYSIYYLVNEAYYWTNRDGSYSVHTLLARFYRYEQSLLRAGVEIA